MTDGQADRICDNLNNIDNSLCDLRAALNSLDLLQREQTAATILAALIQAHAAVNVHNGHGASPPDSYASVAVKWADALRAELAKVPR